MSLRKAAIVPALAVAILPLTAAPAAADHGTDSASGHILVFGQQEFDFSARSSAFGTDSRGRATVAFTSSDPDQVYSGDVTCLRVVGTQTGAIASIGVRITRAPFGNTLQGMTLFVTDSGKFSQQPDGANVAFQATPPPQDACPTPFANTPGDGQVTIHNTFP